MAKRAKELGFSTRSASSTTVTAICSRCSARSEIIRRVVRSVRVATRASSFQQNLVDGRPTTGSAGPALAICTSARRALVHYCCSSAVIRRRRSSSTRRRTSSANSTPRKRARRTARSVACIAPRHRSLARQAEVEDVARRCRRRRLARASQSRTNARRSQHVPRATCRVHLHGRSKLANVVERARDPGVPSSVLPSKPSDDHPATLRRINVDTSDRRIVDEYEHVTRAGARSESIDLS